MPVTLKAEDARRSLAEHVEAKGSEIRAKYGPRIGWAELQQILEDRAMVRYACEIIFNEAELIPGECAFARAAGDRPENGFKVFVHPLLMPRLEDAIVVILYQLAAVNYGELASAEDAEAFGAAALGIEREQYYATLCSIHDEIQDATLAG